MSLWGKQDLLAFCGMSLHYFLLHMYVVPVIFLFLLTPSSLLSSPCLFYFLLAFIPPHSPHFSYSLSFLTDLGQPHVSLVVAWLTFRGDFPFREGRKEGGNGRKEETYLRAVRPSVNSTERETETRSTPRKKNIYPPCYKTIQFLCGARQNRYSN